MPALPPVPQISGPWQHLFDPNHPRVEKKGDWYTNDHSFIRDREGRWHAMGCIGYRPPNPWGVEKQLFHVSGDDLLKGPWQEHPYSLVADPVFESNVWAPYLLEHGSQYWMFYAGANRQPGAESGFSYGTMHMARSPDLFNWQRHDRNPIFADPGHARDPFVMKWNGRFLLYYTRSFNEADQRSCIFVRESPDLQHFTGPKLVHVQPVANRWAGDAESPMVVKRGDVFYLFVCLALTGYDLTRVFWSLDPLNFPIENAIADLPVHAPEVIDLGNDRWVISNTGWYRNGLYTAELKWK